jgi:hypothetical protein
MLKMLSELREEQAKIEHVIAALERLALRQRNGRGRPPVWMSALKDNLPKRRGRPPGSKNKARGELAEIPKTG